MRIWLLVVLPIFSFSIWSFIMWQTIDAHFSNNSTMPLWFVFVMAAFGLVSTILFSWRPITQYLTTFTIHGIKRNYIFWQRFISWNDVREVKIRFNPNELLYSIDVISADASLSINANCYKEPKNIIDLIRSQTKNNVVWSQSSK